MYLEGGPGVEAPCQQLAGLDGHGRQLPLALQDVADGVDVRHVGLLLVVHGDLPVPGERRPFIALFVFTLSFTLESIFVFISTRFPLLLGCYKGISPLGD